MGNIIIVSSAVDDKERNKRITSVYKLLKIKIIIE